MKKHIIQLRDTTNFIVNAEIIDGMVAWDKLTYGQIHSDYLEIKLFIGKEERKFFYEINSEHDFNNYIQDCKTIRTALQKIGGHL